MLIIAVSYGYGFATSFETKLSFASLSNEDVVKLVCETKDLTRNDFDEVLLVHNDKVVHTISVKEVE